MRILVLGTGRMGRDMARTVLGTGWDVTIASRDEGRLTACLAHLGRDIRRLRAGGGPVGAVRGLMPGMDPGDPFDVLYETVEEDLEAKRQVLDHWMPFRAPGGLVLTNTSSLVPWEVHSEALGLHLFYPVVLTGFCEVILPEDADRSVRDRLETLVRRLGLRPLVEVGVGQAQAVNRLLLPSQGWAARRVLRGMDPGQVDQAFGQAWPGLRPLELMETVGLGTMDRAIASFQRRMGSEEARSYDELRFAIEIRANQGRWGPPEAGPGPREADGDPEGPEATEELVQDAEALFYRTCRQALASGALADRDLEVALEAIFGAPWPPPGQRPDDWQQRWERRWRQTGLPWWRPPAATGPVAGGRGTSS